MGGRNGRARRSWRLNASRGVLATAVVALATGTLGHAAQPAAAVDAELLEFLGSLDTEGEDWHEFLEARQIRPEAGKPARKPVTKPVAKDTPQGKPAEQQ